MSAERQSVVRRTGRSAVSILDSLSVFVLLIVAWQVWVSFFNAPEYIVPPPGDVVSEMVTEADYLVSSAWVTFQEFTLGFALAIALGVPLAIGIVSFRPFERMVYPILLTSQVVPKIAIAPLFLIWFGFGIEGKILIAFLIAFFPIVLETCAGLRSLPIEKVYLARSTGAGRLGTFARVRLPNALPAMFTGFKIAVPLAVTGAVVGEYTGADGGLGRDILSASSSGDTAFTFAAVAYVTLMGIAAFFAVTLVERALLPWHVSRRR